MIYVWLAIIKRMISFDSFEEYHASEAYRQILIGVQNYRVMVEPNTPLWKD